MSSEVFIAVLRLAACRKTQAYGATVEERCF
jgi:hypothetical protein